MNGDLTTWLNCTNEPKVVDSMVMAAALRRVHRSFGTLEHALVTDWATATRFDSIACSQLTKKSRKAVGPGIAAASIE